MHEIQVQSSALRSGCVDPLYSIPDGVCGLCGDELPVGAAGGVKEEGAPGLRLR
eukprot:COSAG05_NODE_857_length_6940_cov_4.243385_6_plen_54_part_00